MKPTSFDRESAQRLREAAKITHLDALAVLRRRLCIRVAADLCECVMLTGIFCASDTRLDPAPGDEAVDCGCAECVVARASAP